MLDVNKKNYEETPTRSQKYLHTLPLKVTKKLNISISYYARSREKTSFSHTARRTASTHKGEEVKLGQGDKTEQIYLASL